MFLNLKLSSKSLYGCILLLLFIAAPSLITASDKVIVKDIRYWSSEDYTRIVVDLSEPVQFSKNRLANPDRLYFDLLNTAIAKEIRTNLPVGDGILKTVRASQFNNDTVRVVFDLEEILDYKTFIIDNPARLVIDVYGKMKKADKPGVQIAKKRVVIDAGHGGHDPGAVGLKKLYEKDVVLDIALKLKKILASNQSYEVFLTRDKDIFIPLEERTAIANKKNADLFVSIHANASTRRQAKGIETYLLNWTDDEEAMKVAARENAISFKKMKAIHKQMDIVEIIKSDLMRESKRDESIKLANYIQRTMISNLDGSYKNIPDLGVKQALFYVLFGARMPSVLVEVSFISNPEEEKLLSCDSYRMDIAKAVAEGIHKYFSPVPAVQKVVSFKND
ncbi:MAG: N-acetylmuramoyl-L-alanine amidase [Nitrospira sp.]|nr:N-acetylmuramoyl-L-alanine amidase [Nitrospira sp.]